MVPIVMTRGSAQTEKLQMIFCECKTGAATKLVAKKFFCTYDRFSLLWIGLLQFKEEIGDQDGLEVSTTDEDSDDDD